MKRQHFHSLVSQSISHILNNSSKSIKLYFSYEIMKSHEVFQSFQNSRYHIDSFFQNYQRATSPEENLMILLWDSEIILIVLYWIENLHRKTCLAHFEFYLHPNSSVPNAFFEKICPRLCILSIVGEKKNVLLVLTKKVADFFPLDWFDSRSCQSLFETAWSLTLEIKVVKSFQKLFEKYLKTSL